MIRFVYLGCNMGRRLDQGQVVMVRALGDYHGRLSKSNGSVGTRMWWSYEVTDDRI